MAYSFSQKPNSRQNFGGVVVDANQNVMAGATGSGPQTVDITPTTPLASPLTVSNTVVSTLLIPLNAVTLNILALTNTVNISESDATVASKYFTVPTGVQVSIDVARCSTLYVKANVGASTMSFWFSVI